MRHTADRLVHEAAHVLGTLALDSIDLSVAVLVAVLWAVSALQSWSK